MNNCLDNEGAVVERYTCPTGSGVTVDSLLILGSTPAVAMETGAASETIAVMVGGAHVLPKKAAASTNLTVGGRVYYMTTGGVNKITGAAAAGKLIGYALAVAATGATTGKVRLIRGPTVLETQS